MKTSGPLSDCREFIVRIRAVEWEEGQPHSQAAREMLEYLEQSAGHDYFFFEEVLEVKGIPPEE